MDKRGDCSYETLFQDSQHHFRLIEVPINFPENYLSNRNNLNYFRFKSIRNIDFFIRQRRNKLSGSFLSTKEKIIISNLRLISAGDFFLNMDLSANYASENRFASKTVEQLDQEFIFRIKDNLDDVISSNDFVSSCFRMSKKNRNSYSMFLPEHRIQHDIDSLVKKYRYTIGVHVRRTDHDVAKQ